MQPWRGGCSAADRPLIACGTAEPTPAWHLICHDSRRCCTAQVAPLAGNARFGTSGVGLGFPSRAGICGLRRIARYLLFRMNLMLENHYPPLAEQRCQNCRYHHQSRCRALPPRPNTDDLRNIAVWPFTEDDAWCGNWTSKEWK